MHAKRSADDLVNEILQVADNFPLDFATQFLKTITQETLASFNEVTPEMLQDLGESETILYKLNKVPQLIVRLEHILFTNQFKEELDGLTNGVDSVNTAVESLMKSKPFEEFLTLVRFCGNYMNTGTNKSQAYGFDIKYLTRLGDTKTADNSQTFMNYLSKKLVKDDKFNPLIEILNQTIKASKVSMKDNTASIKKLRIGFDKLTKFVDSPPIRSPKHKLAEHDLFGQKFNPEEALVKNMGKNLSSLESMNKQAETAYTKLSKWLIFEEKKLASDEFFMILSTLKNNLENANRENKLKQEQEIKEEKKRQQAMMQRELAGKISGGKMRLPNGLNSTSGTQGGNGDSNKTNPSHVSSKNSKPSSPSQTDDDDEDYGARLLQAALNTTISNNNMGGGGHRRPRRNPNLNKKPRNGNKGGIGRSALEEELNMMLG